MRIIYNICGKEAEVYVVTSNGAYFCAKVYKEAINRSFKQASQYTEGRKVRGSRQSRANHFDIPSGAAMTLTLGVIFLLSLVARGFRR